MIKIVMTISASLLFIGCIKTSAPNLTNDSVSMKIPADVMAKVAQTFGRQKDRAIKKIQQEFSISHEPQRVLRCVVFLSKGDLDQLSRLIGLADQDYRDILFWAEYDDRNSQNPYRVRNFNNPFGEEGIDNTASTVSDGH